jgi:hypothetical protein
VLEELWVATVRTNSEVASEAQVQAVVDFVISKFPLIKKNKGGSQRGNPEDPIKKTRDVGRLIMDCILSILENLSTLDFFKCFKSFLSRKLHFL